MSKYVSAPVFAASNVCDRPWFEAVQNRAVKLLDRGEAGCYGEFAATVVKHYANGMYEIRTDGGLTTISSESFTTTKPMEMTAEEFNELFQPIKNTLNPNADGAFDGCMFETYGIEYEFIKSQFKHNPRSVWTITDAEDDELDTDGDGQTNLLPILRCGLRNCWPSPIGYLVCGVPHDGNGSVRVD